MPEFIFVMCAICGTFQILHWVKRIVVGRRDTGYDYYQCECGCGRAQPDPTFKEVSNG